MKRFLWLTAVVVLLTGCGKNTEVSDIPLISSTEYHPRIEVNEEDIASTEDSSVSGGDILETITKIEDNSSEDNSTEEASIVEFDYVHLEPEYQGNNEFFYDYYYDNLSEENKEYYENLYYALMYVEEEVDFPAEVSTDTIELIVNSLLYSHPEFVYVNGSSMELWKNSIGDEVQSVQLKISYPDGYSVDDLKAMRNAVCSLETVTDDFASLSDYDKVLSVYNYICNTLIYDKSTTDYDLRNIYYAVMTNHAVCDGYAGMMVYMLNSIDVPAFYVYGEGYDESGTESHAWVCAMLDGNWYFFDPTWGDKTEGENGYSYIDYSYFGLTTEEISTNHTLDDDMFIEVPVCTATKDNYFYHSGLVVSDYTMIENLLNTAEIPGKIMFKCDSEGLYQDIEQQMSESDSFVFTTLSERLMRNYHCGFTFDDAANTVTLMIE